MFAVYRLINVVYMLHVKSFNLCVYVLDICFTDIIPFIIKL